MQRRRTKKMHRGDIQGRSNGEAEDVQRRFDGGCIRGGLLLCILREHHEPARFGSVLRF